MMTLIKKLKHIQVVEENIYHKLIFGNPLVLVHYLNCKFSNKTFIFPERLL